MKAQEPVTVDTGTQTSKALGGWAYHPEAVGRSEVKTTF